MKKEPIIIITITALVFIALSFQCVCAQNSTISGEIAATPTLTDISGNKAKFNEYRDIRDGVFGDLRFKYDSDLYFSDVSARDMGYDTQRYNLDTGKYGDVKFNTYYEEIPHNYTFGAKTFYAGAGTSNLNYTGPAPSTDVSTWDAFDYSVKRKNFGAGFNIDTIRPFFFDASANREDRKGIYPLGSAGTSPGGIAIELPSPVNYRTDNVQLAAGYSKNPLFLSLGFFHSNFTNDNQDLNFRNPSTANTAATTDTFTLPPDNYYYKVDLKGGVKLPYNSKFDLTLGTASAKSDKTLLSSYVSDVTAAASNIGVQGRTGVLLSSPSFNGQLDTTNMGLVLTSKPVNYVDGKVFYKYYSTENKSDRITTTDTTLTPSVLTNPIFDYRKIDYGAELGFRLPARLYLDTTYTHRITSRNSTDIPENDDDTYGVELRWKGTDMLAARVGYERMNRTADFQGTSDTQSLEYYTRRFDAAPQHSDIFKAYVDLFPRDDLNFTLGYRYRDTEYPETILGLQSNRRHEFAVDAEYAYCKRAKLYAFFDYDLIKYEQFQRQLPLGAVSGFDPATPPTATAFNWTAKQKDETYSYTIGHDVFLIPEKLNLILQHSYLNSNGSVDYTYLLGSNPLPAGRTQDNIDLPNWDNYRLLNFLVRLEYKPKKELTIAGGYVYEKFTYNDAQYDGYLYVPATTGTNGAYLTGAYQDPSYTANVFFMTLSYQF